MQMSDFRPCTIVFFLFFLNVDIYIYNPRDIARTKVARGARKKTRRSMRLSLFLELKTMRTDEKSVMRI